MTSKYVSVVYDLTQFGISKISNAMLGSDYVGSNIAFSVSFDGGKTFKKVNSLNEKFAVVSSNGKVQVKIEFLDTDSPNIYTVKATGFFQNLEVGTTIYFKKKSTKEIFSTSLGANGKYTINLPRGSYEIYYISAGKIILSPDYNPESSVQPVQRYDKETQVELFFRDIDWAKYSVFDIFGDDSKMLAGNTIINQNGNLSDGKTDREVQYWALGFE